ncbi:hypothetical protein QRY03_13140 [Enterococcus hirae]|uniref:hypothetical protein n=1 Tax=Enterococcus hirae TaxID=1354 RepID=UPI0014425977|nr:hypothetical protein [Enterococcus hirae]MCR1913714.1 hypothetical protein [Enterococcus hirae]MDL4900805.1 hypothetical protein [Enterococcus hirae]MDL4906026.1 hypothetical protein [Enterococcus hirae]MDL4918827.1 hypothetical protein [Enterococcus hirae]MDL4927963.1 hypothetical protein [Enterococcus hirae]
MTLLLALMPLNTCNKLSYTKEQELICTVLPEVEQLILLFKEKFEVDYMMYYTLE